MNKQHKIKLCAKNTGKLETVLNVFARQIQGKDI